MSMHPYQVLRGPVLTEKATNNQTLECPQYTFSVDVHANKIEIRKAVEAAFKVRVVSVNTLRLKGKRKRLRTQQLGRRATWKKAMVTLAEGDSINLI